MPDWSGKAFSLLNANVLDFLCVAMPDWSGKAFSLLSATTLSTRLF